MTELLPCPFCGGPATPPRELGGFVYCHHCDVMNPDVGTDEPMTVERAIAAWNTRAPGNPTRPVEPGPGFCPNCQHHVDWHSSGSEAVCGIDLCGCRSMRPVEPEGWCMYRRGDVQCSRWHGHEDEHDFGPTRPVEPKEK